MILALVTLVTSSMCRLFEPLTYPALGTSVIYIEFKLLETLVMNFEYLLPT